MSQFSTFAIAATALVVTALVPAAPAAEPAWIAESNQKTQILLEVNARYQPESMASLGLEQYDREILDLKPGFDERQEADIAAAIMKLEAARGGMKDERARQDIETRFVPEQKAGS